MKQKKKEKASSLACAAITSGNSNNGSSRQTPPPPNATAPLSGPQASAIAGAPPGVVGQNTPHLAPSSAEQQQQTSIKTEPSQMEPALADYHLGHYHDAARFNIKTDDQYHHR